MSSYLASYNVPREGVHQSILDTIGKTPVIRLRSEVAPSNGVTVYVKLESENPGGSVKDRLAYGVIEWAEQHGHLKPGQVSMAYGSLRKVGMTRSDRFARSFILLLWQDCH